MPYALRPSIRSAELEAAINSAKDERPFLVDGLLYEKGSLLVSGDPGAGKSLVMVSAFAQCTLGLPVFDQLPCARPLNCYCLFSERINQEAVERLRLIRKRVPIDVKRLCLDDGFVGIADVTRSKFADEILERIKTTTWDEGKTDLVGLDSLYGFIPGGLSKDEKASEFARFIARLQSELGVALWLVHHTTKPTYDNAGGRIEKDDPFYGSQWLKAMVTGAYYLRSDGNGGVLLSRKKDTFGGLIRELPLSYDAQTHVVSLDADKGMIQAPERALFWLSTKNGKEFSFEDFCKGVGCSDQHGRRLVKSDAIAARIKETGRSSHGRVIYSVKPLDGQSAHPKHE